MTPVRGTGRNAAGPPSALKAAEGNRAPVNIGTQAEDRIRRVTVVAASVATLAILGASFVVVRARRPFLARFRPDVDALVSPARIGAMLDVLGRNPHRAGTAGSAAVAEEIARRLTEAGLKTWNDVHEVDLWEPVALSLALTGPAPRTFDLGQGKAGDDAPFLAYAADGDVEAPLVFAGGGAPADFDTLRKAGVDARGKIVLVDAWGSTLAMKAYTAERAGAAGLLVYREPRKGSIESASPGVAVSSRPPSESGTLLRTFLRPGDPASAKAAGIDTLPRIPALSVGADVAETLLGQMRGPAAPAAWKGVLAAPYNLGSGATRVRMSVRGRIVRATIRNVLATIPGEDAAAGAVVVGSRSDAWGSGPAARAPDTAILLEAAGVLARLGERGWKPSRPILFAFFDGEAYGMLGSTAWLKGRLTAGSVPALAFVNVDATETGEDLRATATPGLGESLAGVLSAARDSGLGAEVSRDAATPALPAFSSDAATFLGFSATPVVELRFGRPYGTSHGAALARLLALYTGVLATPRFFPFRFEEISTFTNRGLREMSRDHPAAASWILSALRPLATQIDVYAAAAKVWDLRARKSESFGRGASLLDRHVASAIGAFGASGEVFGRGCCLWGTPVQKDGRATALPALEEVVARGDRLAAAREADLLAQAFVRARSELSSADLIISGARRPEPPASSGYRKQ